MARGEAAEEATEPPLLPALPPPSACRGFTKLLLGLPRPPLLLPPLLPPLPRAFASGCAGAALPAAPPLPFLLRRHRPTASAASSSAAPALAPK